MSQSCDFLDFPYAQNWLAVASADHVRCGCQAGFMQVCHGKAAPLRRIRPNDYIVYYSPTTTFRGKDKLQSFTAMGKVNVGDPYQVDMGKEFCPFRRDVTWFNTKEAQIAPLLHLLELTQEKTSWGYQLRFGLLKISAHDMQLIANAMQAVLLT